MQPPRFESLSTYYRSYYGYLQGDHLVQSLKEEASTIASLVDIIGMEKELFAYAPGKWTIREVLGHLIDTERILSYRALRISRKDCIELPGFDENEYVKNSNFNTIPVTDLCAEWLSVRAATILLFEHMDEQVLDFIGKANGMEVSPRMLAYMILTHAVHHLKVMEERYLTA